MDCTRAILSISQIKPQLRPVLQRHLKQVCPQSRLRIIQPQPGQSHMKPPRHQLGPDPLPLEPFAPFGVIILAAMQLPDPGHHLGRPVRILRRQPILKQR